MGVLTDQTQSKRCQIMGSANADPTREFSRPVRVADLPGDGVETRRLSASPDECALLARRLDLLALDSLAADIVVAPGSVPGQWEVSGRLVADVVQTCVVSLVAVPGRVDESFSTLYAEPGAEPPEAEDEPPEWEPVEEGVIDLGEEVAQQLSLALDPYPKAPGAQIDERWVSQREDGEGPFGALAGWRQKGR